MNYHCSSLLKLECFGWLKRTPLPPREDKKFFSGVILKKDPKAKKDKAMRVGDVIATQLLEGGAEGGDSDDEARGGCMVLVQISKFIPSSVGNACHDSLLDFGCLFAQKEAWSHPPARKPTHVEEQRKLKEAFLASAKVRCPLDLIVVYVDGA